MAFILTFLGKGGVGRTTVAIAAARQLASQGQRVLLVGQQPGPALGLLLGLTPTLEPQEFCPNGRVVQLQTAALLEQSWDEVKRLEAEYVRTPFFKEVYGQELAVLPGMDSALALNALREYEASGQYDTIIYDGAADQATLRMLGMPEILSWYLRRFRQVLVNSDFWKALSPFIQPVSSAVLNVNWGSGDMFQQPVARQANNLLDDGKAAVADPNRVAAWLVATPDDAAIATARYLWGAAQQVGVTVGGLLLNQVHGDPPTLEGFAPLPVNSVPAQPANDWQALMAAMPDFRSAAQMPRPVAVNVSDRTVSLFLPGFDKQQVKLTQYGPEITIEAGDQRRNVFLPDALRGKAVSGARFQESFLIVSFAS